MIRRYLHGFALSLSTLIALILSLCNAAQLLSTTSSTRVAPKYDRRVSKHEAESKNTQVHQVDMKYSHRYQKLSCYLF